MIRTYADSPIGASALAADAAIGATGLTLAADDLPASLTANFSITVGTGAGSESLTVQTRTGTALTLTAPTTKVHSAGDPVDHQLTAADADNFAQSDEVTTAIAAIDFPVDSVAGKTGAVLLTKSDVGLGNADNTADANKPVSTAQAAAIEVARTTADAISIQTYPVASTDDGAVPTNGQNLQWFDYGGGTGAWWPATPALNYVEMPYLSSGQVRYAIGASDTTLKLKQTGGGTFNLQASQFPAMLVIEDGTGNEEFVLLPTVGTNVGSGFSAYTQFDNVMRNCVDPATWDGTGGIAHAANKTVKFCSLTDYTHKMVLPVPQTGGIVALMGLMGSPLNITDTHDPMTVFLPPVYPIGGWNPPEYLATLSVVVDESYNVPNRIALTEPYNGDVLVTFAATSSRKAAEFIYTPSASPSWALKSVYGAI